MSAPPSAILAPLGATSWPADAAARRAITCSLRSIDRDAWRALVAWAWSVHHDESIGGAPLRAVARELGVSRDRLIAWRRDDETLRALPAVRVKRPSGAARVPE